MLFRSLQKAKGGEKLTDEEYKTAYDNFQKERELDKQIHNAEIQQQKEKFEKQLQELKNKYEEQFAKTKQSTPKTKTEQDKERLLSKSGKKAADAIRRLKMPKGTRIDFSLGTWDLAVEGVAKLVEGGMKTADAIAKMIEDGIIKFKTDKDKNDFEGLLTGAFEKQEKRDAILQIGRAHV